MKTNYLKIFTALALFGFVFASCNGDEPSRGTTSHLKTGQVEVIFQPQSSDYWDRTFGFGAMARTITIDWGDGTIQEFRPNGHFDFFSHQFQTGYVYTILISTDELTVLWINGDELRINNAPSLISLQARDFTTFEITRADALRYLSLSFLPYRQQTLNTSRFLALEYLEIAGGHQTSLDLSRNTALRGLYVEGATALDVSNNIALRYLTTGEGGSLTSLDVSNNTALRMLDVRNNQLTALDVSNNTKLESLDVSNNQLTAQALNALFESLPPFSGSSGAPGIFIWNNPGADTADRSIAENKGWTVH